MDCEPYGAGPPPVNPLHLQAGGATWWFRQTGSLDQVATRGRWAQVRTARIYVDAAMAEQGAWLVPDEGMRFGRQISRVLRQILEQAQV